MMTVTAESEVDLKLYELLEEFISLLRRGQGIPVREFARRYPQYCDRIVADFPALLMAEGLKPRLSMAPGVTAPIAPAEAPVLLAGYRVIRQIGQGGMGIVYEAEHPRLSRRLAIKVLPGQKGKATVTERFRREAEAASRLNHPNIVPVFDFGEQNGVQYLAMAMIEGNSLDHLLEQYRTANNSAAATRSSAGLLTMVTNQPWMDPPHGSANAFSGQPGERKLIGPEADFKKLATLGADVAAALAHAHANKTIHRDIKPGNLILDNAGKIWVTDFGLAKIRDDDSDLSRTGDIIGTPRFMAPEQLRGHCDERSDIYSLGITLYEMASGTRAWDSLGTAQLLKVRASAELPELSEQAPFVPQPLADIIMKACSNRPEDRYQTAQEMQLVLNRFAHGQKTGDRRRRPRNGTSFLDRRWVVAACSLGVPATTFAIMYVLSMGPWVATKITTPEVLMSLVQDVHSREKVAEHLPDVIEAAITSKDEKIREQAADLTLQVVAEAFRKADAQNPNASPAQRQETLKLVKGYTDEFKRSGFVYDKMNHPLTNAIRNLDLAEQISDLTLSSRDKLEAQAKIAAIGEAIRSRFITESEAQALLEFLPETARTQPTTEKVSPPSLVRFIMLLKETYTTAGERFSREKHLVKEKLEQELLKRRKGMVPSELIPGMLGSGGKRPASTKQMPY